MEPSSPAAKQVVTVKQTACRNGSPVQFLLRKRVWRFVTTVTLIYLGQPLVIADSDHVLVLWLANLWVQQHRWAEHDITKCSKLLCEDVDQVVRKNVDKSRSFKNTNFNWKKKKSNLIFEVLTTTWRVPPGHILTNLIINALLDANADRKWGKSPILWSVNGLWLQKRTVR